MNKTQITKIVQSQRDFFMSGQTLDIGFRKAALRRLKAYIIKYADELEAAMQEDLCKSDVEGYLCDIGPSIMEINETIKGLNKWSRSETHFSGLLC